MVRGKSAIDTLESRGTLLSFNSRVEHVHLTAGCVGGKVILGVGIGSLAFGAVRAHPAATQTARLKRTMMGSLKYKFRKKVTEPWER